MKRILPKDQDCARYNARSKALKRAAELQEAVQLCYGLKLVLLHPTVQEAVNAIPAEEWRVLGSNFSADTAETDRGELRGQNLANQAGDVSTIVHLAVPELLRAAGILSEVDDSFKV